MSECAASTAADLAERLYSFVPADGSTVTNRAVRAHLGCSEEEYWPIKNQLVAGGQLFHGRGRGGTLRRAEVDEQAPPAIGPALAPVVRESDLYEPMAAVIRGDRARDLGSAPLGVVVTAMQGSRLTGGPWSRPDIACVEIRAYPYVPGKWLNLTTFEVKAADSISSQAVYEARSHRNAATHAYVLLHVPDPIAASAQIDNVVAAARQQDIGVIVAGDPGDYDTWEEKLEAPRVEPDPDQLNQFITTQLPDSVRHNLACALR
ncbi:hypothetical protein ABIC28_001622 [Rhodococcus sp. PvR044]|uniref:hypothetical protein n=1 Tax=Rhodococcus sp. PvR044 TaxID=3156402 RepID=UPI003396D5B3